MFWTDLYEILALLAGEEMTYPFVCFTVDNFDEAFSDIQVETGTGVIAR